jgi:hypothetical protein
MITHWQYNTIVKNLTVDVKKLISENNYKTIDIGASLQFWSYPECKFVADIVRIEKEDVKELLDEFKFMEGIDTLEKLKEFIQTPNFWADTILFN